MEGREHPRKADGEGACAGAVTDWFAARRLKGARGCRQARRDDARKAAPPKARMARKEKIDMQQMTLDDALAAANTGMARALDRAERDTPDWADTAYKFLEQYAARNREFPGFFVTAASELDKSFPVPSNERAWGGIYRRAQKDGIIIKIAQRMKHPKRHGSEAIVYRSLVYVA